jgi:hypothetical protein
VGGARRDGLDAGVGGDRSDGQSMPCGHWRDPTDSAPRGRRLCTKCPASSADGSPRPIRARGRRAGPPSSA